MREQDRLDPDRSSPFHRLANRIVFHHEIKLAAKYDELGRKEAEEGKVEDAEAAHFDAKEIRDWLKDNPLREPPTGR